MTSARHRPRPRSSPATAAGKAGTSRTLWGDVRYELVRSPVFWFSIVLVIVILLMAFVPQLFAATSPNESGACQLENARVGPTADKPFGYTVAGCDMWASLVYGTGKSVIVAILVDPRHVAHRGHHRHRRRLVRRLHRHHHQPDHRRLLRPAVHPRRAGVPRDLPGAQHLDHLGGADRARLDLDHPGHARQRDRHQATRLRRRGPGAGRRRLLHHPQAHPGQQHRAGHRARRRSTWAPSSAPRRR